MLREVPAEKKPGFCYHLRLFNPLRAKFDGTISLPACPSAFFTSAIFQPISIKLGG
jgi:hypothetical protein